MLFRLSLKKLCAMSRQLATMLEAGLPIQRALGVLERGARGADREMVRRLSLNIERGATFSEAIQAEGRAFPPLYVRLIRVAEAVGGMDRVLARLADYYELVRTMWKRLISSLIYPIFQLIALILILAGVAYLVNMLAGSEAEGMRQAKRTLTIGFLILLSPVALYLFFTRVLSGGRVIDEIVLRVPVLGRVTRMLALARFSLSMELMTDAGVSILNAIPWSLQSTGNAAYEARAERMVQWLKDGMSLSEVLDKTGLFPVDYIEMIHVGETAGSMPDMFRRLARNHFENAEDAMRVLTATIAWIMRVTVAGVIIYYIFKFLQQYIGMLNSVAG